MNILIIEDEPTAQLLLEDAARLRGHNTKTAGTGKQAKALLTSECQGFDFVILDTRLPDCRGLELVDDCRQAGVRQIVMATGDATYDQQRRASELGIDGYFTKPFDPVELIKNLERLSETDSQAVCITA